MSKKSLIPVLLLMLSCFTGIATETSVTGKAEGAGGQMIRLMTYTDQVSYLRRTLVAATIAEDGTFRLNFDLDRTIYAWLDIGFRHGDIFLQPGQSYEVEIQASAGSLSASYYDRSPLPVRFLHDDADHLNMYIMDFNQIYNDFMFNYAGGSRSTDAAGSYNSFRAAVDLRFKNAANPYFRDYVRYSCASVEMFLRVRSRDKAGLEYLAGQPMALDNIAYMDFLQMYFEKYFISGNKYFGYNKTYDLINGNASLEAVLDSLGADPVLQDRGLRELVLLSGLKELYSASGFSKPRIIQLVGQISETGDDPGIRSIAGNLLDRFYRLKPGSSAPDFSLPQVSGERIYSLKDFEGKLTYIAFFDSKNPASQAEMAMIGGFYDDLKNKVNFVAVSVDQDPSVIAGNPNIPPGTWTLLYYDHDLDLLESYDAIAYPYFVLIDSRGKILRCPAPSPSEDIRSILMSF